MDITNWDDHILCSGCIWLEYRIDPRYRMQIKTIADVEQQPLYFIMLRHVGYISAINKSMSEINIRLFDKGDTESFLELYEQIFNKPGKQEWFEWKYQNNPYMQHVPIYVAKDKDKVIGARPFFALDVAWDDKTWTAIQPCDTMVHPDYRGQGIFTRMTQQSLDFYSDQPVDLIFNFPNDKSRPGYLKMDWKEVMSIPEWYRFNDLNKPIASESESRFLNYVSNIITNCGAIYNSLCDWTSPSPSPRIETEVTKSIPTQALTELYEYAKPNSIHAVRNEQFYNWRFNNPQRQYKTILAKEKGTVKGAAITGMPKYNELTHARITEILPKKNQDSNVIISILDRIIDEYSHADVISAFDEMLTKPHRWGFISDKRFPLSNIRQSTYLLTRPVDLGKGWYINEQKITDPDSWSITYSEWDTS